MQKTSGKNISASNKNNKHVKKMSGKKYHVPS